MATASAISSTSGRGSPAAISAPSFAMTFVVPSRNHSTSTSGCIASNASTVARASSLGCEV